MKTIAARGDIAVIPETSRRRWGLPHYLAIIGIPVLVLEIWTLTAWLMDGPYQITEYRSPTRNLDWWGARILEGLTILVSLAVLRYVVRGCRRQKKFFTFDVLFLLASATQFWAMGVANYFQPMFSYNSELVNLNDPCGHIPFIVNPDCGRIPSAVIFVWLLLTFGVLGCAIVLQHVVGRLRDRHPDLSRAQLIGILFIGGCVLVALEPLFVMPLHGWTYPGAPLSFTIGGSGMRYPIFPEMIAFSSYLVTATAVRMFKDDKGMTVIERGLDRYTPRARLAVTLMAMYTVFQFMVWIPGTAFVWPIGFHQQKWGTITRSLNNGLCNQPGIVEHTRYGPCPGTPGFRMPIPDSLPGRSP